MSSTTTTTEKVEDNVKFDGNLRLNSMTTAMIVYWLLPVLCIAILSRFAVDSGPVFLPKRSRSIPFSMYPQVSPNGNSGPPAVQKQHNRAEPAKKTKESVETFSFLSNKPKSYQEVRSVHNTKETFGT